MSKRKLAAEEESKRCVTFKVEAETKTEAGAKFLEEVNKSLRTELAVKLAMELAVVEKVNDQCDSFRLCDDDYDEDGHVTVVYSERVEYESYELSLRVDVFPSPMFFITWCTAYSRDCFERFKTVEETAAFINKKLEELKAFIREKD